MHVPPITLAIDYGTKRVGLARSYGTLAEPLRTIENDEHLLEILQEICFKEGIEQVVIGLSEQAMAEASREFAQRFRQVSTLPIFFADETLSSHAAEQTLHQLGKTRPGQRPTLDHVAAAHFLQEWLDTRPDMVG